MLDSKQLTRYRTYKILYMHWRYQDSLERQKCENGASKKGGRGTWMVKVQLAVCSPECRNKLLVREISA
jgi:hypothetical protein